MSIDLDSLLDGLNPQQRDAASAGDDPLLVIAGAGSGKTKTLAHRVAYLIARGTSPARILLLTFSRRSAKELEHRCNRILGGAGLGGQAARVWSGTFHAVATRLLRIHGSTVGLAPGFTIHDRGDSEDLMNTCRAELGLATKDRAFPKKGTCMDIYSRCINARAKPKTVIESTYPWCVEDEADLQRLFGAYLDRKTAQSILDFDDLLLYWATLLETAGDVIRQRFDHVLVDEYQDTNALQADILRQLRPDGRGLTVVGDDAQSIYSFRAATVRNILDFPAQYPGARVVKLEVNYRSVPGVIAATNAVIALAAERHEKELRAHRIGGEMPRLAICADEEGQTTYIVERILAHREEGIELKRQAVLFRSSHHSLALELELGRRNIPFVKYGGLKFVEAAHVKDVCAFMRFVENPRDSIAGVRMLCLLPGVGPAKAKKLLEHVGDRPWAHWGMVKIPSSDAGLWGRLLVVLREIAAGAPLARQVQLVRQLYADLVGDRFDNLPARLRDLEQLEAIAERYPDRESFLAEITLDPPSSTKEAGRAPQDDDCLVLSTIHSAKGLEWDAVYVLHAAEGCIPSDRATGDDEIEEERRLFYVALTRARDHLYVCFPQLLYVRGGDGAAMGQITRFLPMEVQILFERRTIGRQREWGGAVGLGARAPAEEVQRRVRGWLE